METINEKDTLAYKIGGLLYTPALNTKIADKIIQKKKKKRRKTRMV